MSATLEEVLRSLSLNSDFDETRLLDGRIIKKEGSSVVLSYPINNDGQSAPITKKSKSRAVEDLRDYTRNKLEKSGVNVEVGSSEKADSKVFYLKFDDLNDFNQSDIFESLTYPDAFGGLINYVGEDLDGKIPLMLLPKLDDKFDVERTKLSSVEGGTRNVYEIFKKGENRSVWLKVDKNPNGTKSQKNKDKGYNTKSEIEGAKKLFELSSSGFDKLIKNNISPIIDYYDLNKLGSNGVITVEYKFDGAQSLSSFLNNNSAKDLSDNQLNSLLLGMINGPKFLNNHNFLHRDIKPSNYMVVVDDDKINVMLFDFVNLIHEDDNSQNLEKDFFIPTSGSRNFVNPFLFEKFTGSRRPYDKQDDFTSVIYSMLSVLTGNQSFQYTDEVTGVSYFNLSCDEQDKVRSLSLNSEVDGLKEINGDLVSKSILDNDGKISFKLYSKLVNKILSSVPDDFAFYNSILKRGLYQENGIDNLNDLELNVGKVYKKNKLGKALKKWASRFAYVASFALALGYGKIKAIHTDLTNYQSLDKPHHKSNVPGKYYKSKILGKIKINQYTDQLREDILNNDIYMIKENDLEYPEVLRSNIENKFDIKSVNFYEIGLNCVVEVIGKVEPGVYALDLHYNSYVNRKNVIGDNSEVKRFSTDKEGNFKFMDLVEANNVCDVDVLMGKIRSLETTKK